MFNNSHKDKYLKYKTKYLNLKKNININSLINQQKGGMGFHTSYWNQHPSFIASNKNLLKHVSLSILNTEENLQYGDYSLMLDNLLKITDGVIDLNFINNFSRHIYYDINGENFGINSVGKDMKWKDDTKTKYNITRSIIQPHLNTTILFLKSKTDESTKVLKIFNKINIDINAIKDYLSLEITHIDISQTSDKSLMEFQNNYNRISKERFDSINFNMETEFITTNNERDYLYLSCRNNDAINDYIINLILQKINETTSFNFVKYDNLFVTQVDGIYKYCILMEHMDGTLNNYIETLPINQYDILYNILNKIDIDLNILKVKKHLFTHTDMKCENVFCKKIGDTIVPYLADFDKSSISFHNIRFYNDITTNSTFITAGIVDPMSFMSYYLKDGYTLEQTKRRQRNYDSDEIFKYRLSRIGRHVLPRAKMEFIETEQTYMRYNYTPFYTSFDMCSLIISLFITKKILNLPPPANNLYKLFIKYIAEEYLEIIRTIYFDIKLSKTGDFGKILTEILIKDKEDISECFIHKFIKDKAPSFINKLYLTHENKICLSIPFVPIVNQIENIDANITQFRYHKPGTNKLYEDEKVRLLERLPHNIEDRLSDFIIEYNNDYATGARAWFSKPPYIVATNRYSHKDKFRMGMFSLRNSVYDYDDVIIEDVKKIYDFILSTRNI
jgi:hypothetical protein